MSATSYPCSSAAAYPSGAVPSEGGGGGPRNYLKSNGTNTFYCGGTASIAINDTFEFDCLVQPAVSNYRIKQEGSSNWIVIRTDNTVLFGGLLSIDGVPMTSGQDISSIIGSGKLHRFHWTMTASSAVHSGFFPSTSTPPNGVIVANIIYTDDSSGEVTTWAVDSGSTTTEAPSNGGPRGDITFTNTTAGDWEELTLELAPQA